MPRGFSLIETIVAIGLLTGALLTLSQLVAAAVHTTAVARYRTVAAILAQQKIEQLRGEATLDDTSGAVEHLDGEGLKVCEMAPACPAAVFLVRWSVAALVSAPGSVLIQVVISHAHHDHGEIRLFAIRPRSVR